MSIQWMAWGTTVRVEVTEPAALPAARRLVAGIIARAEREAALEFSGAKVHRLTRAVGRPTTVSTSLADLVAVALTAAELSAGAVDLTVGATTLPLRRAAAGHWPERTARFPVCVSIQSARPRPAPGWRTVYRAGRSVAVPAGTCLDLTATAKARTAYLAAARVAGQLGVGALVELGGDLATAGPAPDGGWLIAPEHGGGAVAQLQTGNMISSCRAVGIVDPLTGRMVDGPWAAIAVLGPDLVTAKTAAVAALVHGADAEDYLDRLGLTALFVPKPHPAVIM